MSLDVIKLELVQLLLQIKEESTLYKVKSILEKEGSKDWWDDLSQEQQRRIEQGKKEADMGLLEDHSEVMRVFDKWVTK